MHSFLYHGAYRAVNLVVGYVGILVGLFHKILFGGSVSRQKASFAVRKTNDIN